MATLAPARIRDLFITGLRNAHALENQALAMMNSVRINLAVRAIGNETVLGRLLEENDDDGPAIAGTLG